MTPTSSSKGVNGIIPVRRTKPVFFQNDRAVLLPGDCSTILLTLPENSVDAVVTDPPYCLTSIRKRFSKTHIEDDTKTSAKARLPRSEAGPHARQSRGFMGHAWDDDIAFDPETWAALLRVAKPGAYLAAFAARKNRHRMVCAIEDAGWTIHDELLWAYGSGMPIGNKSVPDAPGMGTTLKPCYEPITVARKPLSEKTYAANWAKWGTGLINIDGCRVESAEHRIAQEPGYAAFDQRNVDAGIRPKVYRVKRMKSGAELARTGGNYRAEDETEFYEGTLAPGRWPSTLLTDGSEEVFALFPASKGQLAKASTSDTRRAGQNVYGEMKRGSEHAMEPRNDSGSAARFFNAFPYTDEDSRIFYSGKANKADRAGSSHPTVKPIALMRWLCRMVTPPGGLVLDPFSGSGATGEAAIKEGLSAVLLEREEIYQADICRRMENLACTE